MSLNWTDDDTCGDPSLWPWVLATFAVAFAMAFLSSCATYAVVVDAPAEFWLTGEALVMALLEDLWAIVDLFL